MAIGLTPTYQADFPLDNLRAEHFFVMAAEVLLQMRCSITGMTMEGINARTNYGTYAWNAEITVRIENGFARIKSTSAAKELLDWGRNKKLTGMFRGLFDAIKVRLTPEETEAKYQYLRGNNFITEGPIPAPPAIARKGISGVPAIFIPARGYFITPLIIDANILIFVLMAISGVSIMLPDNASLLQWGANFRPLTLDGQLWRLLTNCFLHIGVIHLLMNMYALFFIGLLLEPHLGKARFLSAYLLTGIAGSVASLWWHDLTISAGASGAIFGMYGVFLALLTTSLVEKKQRRALLFSILFFVGYNLLNGVKGGIDNAAHIGGLFSGIIIGYASVPTLNRSSSPGLKYTIIVALSVALLSLCFVVVKNTPRDMVRYEANMAKFDANERTGLLFYRTPGDSPKALFITALKDSGISKWNENLMLLDENKKMKLPASIQLRNSKLIRYCELRITSYEVMCKYFEEGREEYKKQFEEDDIRIKSIIDDLKGAE